MKLLFENWRKLLEGEVIDFPTPPRVSDEDMQRVITLEDSIGNLLGDVYGNQSEIPIDVINKMDELVNIVEESLKR